ncbi:MAG: TIGR01459 family HAD-type hydrolase [Hyphomonadaceae bacterium]
MTIIETIDAIAGDYDAVFCDLWGVVHNGKRPYPTAFPALQRLRAAGKTVILLTNVPKPRGPIPAQLDRIGVPRDAYDAIVTSGDAIRAELAKRAPGPMFKIGPGDFDRALWEGLGLDEAPLAQARFIGISGLFRDDETPADYVDIVRDGVARDLEMLCANPDIVVQFGDRLIWCAGAIARDYAEAGGRVVMAGKPFAPIYELAYGELTQIAGKPVDKARILCIGDGVPTDIAGANGQGLDCVFIASGMHGEALWSHGAVDRESGSRARRRRARHLRHVRTGLAQNDSTPKSSNRRPMWLSKSRAPGSCRRGLRHRRCGGARNAASEQRCRIARLHRQRRFIARARSGPLARAQLQAAARPSPARCADRRRRPHRRPRARWPDRRPASARAPSSAASAVGNCALIDGASL